MAHIGVLLVAPGITASATFRTEAEATLRPRQTPTVSRRTAHPTHRRGRDRANPALSLRRPTGRAQANG